jgi:hypothetical protein
MQDLGIAWKKSLDATSLVGRSTDGGSGPKIAEFNTRTSPIPPGDLPAQFNFLNPGSGPFGNLTSAGGAVTVAAPAPKPTWYRHTAFIQFCVCVSVLLVSFVILITIRPQFLYKTPKDKLKAEEFSSTRAFVVSVIAAVVCGIVMFILAMIEKGGTRASSKS